MSKMTCSPHSNISHFLEISVFSQKSQFLEMSVLTDSSGCHVPLLINLVNTATTFQWSRVAGTTPYPYYRQFWEHSQHHILQNFFFPTLGSFGNVLCPITRVPFGSTTAVLLALCFCLVEIYDWGCMESSLFPCQIHLSVPSAFWKSLSLAWNCICHTFF